LKDPILWYNHFKKQAKSTIVLCKGKSYYRGPSKFLTSLSLLALKISILEGPHSKTFSYTSNHAPRTHHCLLHQNVFYYHKFLWQNLKLGSFIYLLLLLLFSNCKLNVYMRPMSRPLWGELNVKPWDGNWFQLIVLSKNQLIWITLLTKKCPNQKLHHHSLYYSSFVWRTTYGTNFIVGGVLGIFRTKNIKSLC